MFNRHKLIAIMNEKNITMYKLWKLSGIAQSTISNIINNDGVNPKSDTLSKFASVLDCSIDEFFDDTNESSNVAENISHYGNSIEFKTAQEAAEFILKQPAVAAYGGFDLNKMSDNEIMDFANELLRQLKLLGYKYNK